MNTLRHLIVVLLAMALTASAFAAGQKTSGNIKAQEFVASMLTAHPELESIELSSTPPGKSACVTIAATEAKEIGAKCDEDELTAIKTNRPFAESEMENGNRVWDVTAPLHDANGKLIGTLGMDVKPASGQTRKSVLEMTAAVVQEFERKIPSKATLFEPVR